MKKKILLFALMIAVLTCLFAVSISAVTPNNDGEVYVASDGTTLALYDTDGNALAWFKDPTTSEYVAYRPEIDFTFTFVSSGKELSTNSTTINDTDGDANTTFPYSLSNMILLNGRDYEVFTHITGSWKTFPLEAIYVNNNFQWINKNAFQTDTYIRVFDIPKTHTASFHFGAYSFHGASNLTKFYIPSKTDFEGTSHLEGSGITSVEFGSNCTFTAIPNYLFYNCSNLTGSVVIPESVTSIGERSFAFKSYSANTNELKVTLPKDLSSVGSHAFQNNGSLVEVKFTGTSLTSIDSPAFENCKKLTGIALPEGLTTLGNCAFKNCSGLKSVTLPSSLSVLNGGEHFYGTALEEVIGLENTQITKISKYMFRGMKTWIIDKLVLPNTVTSIEQNGIADIPMRVLVLGAGITSMYGDELAGCKSLVEVYIPAGLTTLKLNNSTARLVFTTAKNADSLTITSSNGFTKTDSNVITYAQYLEGKDTTYSTGKWIITGYNACDAFYNGKHVLDEAQSNACVGICENCKELSLSANPVHQEIVAITYDDFAKAGTKVTTCGNENCPLHEEIPVDAIFSVAKFSLKDDNTAICVSYTINNEAYNAFLAENEGASLEFGLVAAASLTDEIADPLNSTNIKHNLTNGGYSAVDLKLTGDWATQNGVFISMALYTSYTAEDGATPSVRYITEDGSSTACKAITYQALYDYYYPAVAE